MKNNAVRIFISYAREDGRDLALRLYSDLQAMGYAAWMDVSDIGGGSVWSVDIEEAIEQCDVMLALLSFGSYRSEYCRAEQLRAIRKGKRLVPVLVQANADRPIHLEHLNYLDFSNPERYDEMWRDLLSDINAGRAFLPPSALETGKTPSSVFKTTRGPKSSVAEKRDAGAFRRYLGDLRQSDWLGARYWWTYFLFTYMNLADAAQVLQAGVLPSPAQVNGTSKSRWDDSVRLHFRPRVPELWHAEGVRPAAQRRFDVCPMPVYLLFDLEAIICQPEVRFSAGDPVQTKKTYATANAFSELPFEAIYHDSTMRSDERDEIIQSRRAQVMVPRQLGLESLQYIWCRSNAEYETLRYLLPPNVWQQWRDKVTPRTDYTLFHRRWAFVEDALLTAEGAFTRFNRCSDDAASPFDIRAAVTTFDGQRYQWSVKDYVANSDLQIDLSALKEAEGYNFELYLDGTMVYGNRFSANDGLL